MEIRKVSSDDRDTIISIINRNVNFTAEEKDCAAELLDIYLGNPCHNDYDFFCAVNEGNKVIGYICYGRVPLTESTYDLYWIVVDPLFHSMGIGKMLVDYLESMLINIRARMLLAETSSRSDYYKTRVFYEQNSFTEAARIKDFYRAGDDKIIYKKTFV